MDAPAVGYLPKKLLEYWASMLRHHGYVVVPRERHRVVQSRCIVPPHDMEWCNISMERFEDMMRAKALRGLIAEADSAGLIVHERQDLNDPVTGREVVFTSAMGLIKPKAEDRC